MNNDTTKIMTIEIQTIVDTVEREHAITNAIQSALIALGLIDPTGDTENPDLDFCVTVEPLPG